MRAAASSSASGSPSRRTHSWATASAFSSESSKSGRASRARATKSRTASVRRRRSSSRGSRRVGKLERGDAVEPLFGDVERRAAGDEQRQAGCTASSSPSIGAGVEQVLEVVEHERAPAGRAARRPALPAIRGPGLSTRPSAPAIVGRDEVGVADRGELDEHHAARELGVESRRGLDRRAASCPFRPVPSASGGAHLPRPAARGSPAAPCCGPRTRSIALAVWAPAGPPEAPKRRPAPDPDRGSPARGCAMPTPARSRAARPGWLSPPGRRPAPPPACPSGRGRASAGRAGAPTAGAR